MQIGASTPPATSGWGFTPPAKADPTRQAFQDYEKLTPAEKERKAILGSLGLTEEQVDAMSPEDRAKIEAKIREIMRQKVEQSTEKKTGQIIDLKA